MKAEPIAFDTLAPAVLNAIPHPVVVIDAEDRIAVANQAAEGFFQSSALFLARHPLAYFVPFGSPLLGLMEQVRERAAAVTEYRVDVSSPRVGPDRIVDIFASPMAEQPGHVTLMLVARSVTEKIDRQLTHRGAARTVTGLASMLAHEIKNPLAGIRGAAQLLETEAEEDDRALTRLICEEADRIVRLVDRMEIFADDRPAEREPLNIHAVLERVKVIAATGFARDVRIVEDYDPSLPPVLANRDQLLQVFVNLVKNAVEACGGQRDAEILFRTAFRPGIRVSVPGSRSKVGLPLEFTIMDNGPGVPDDLLPYIFDPFVTSKANGTGLGLALVSKIIGDHGGVIECESQPRRTAFRVLMPTHAGDAPEEKDFYVTTGTILVADDDAAIRTVLNQALSRAGYTVRLTSNVATLWRWVAEGEGDVVVTDVVMPDGNAFDLIPRIKRTRPDLPIIVMSAQNTFLTAIRASEKGAYEYLPKPFDLKELAAVVGRALAEPRGQRRLESEAEGTDAIPLVGRSAAMQDIYRVLARLMQTDLTVMISGESGTGKELVARALHDYGKRRKGPFVAVNMAAIPRDLIELELFGHERGAFTGAQARSVGRFEQAEGGTLFLDEIGDMPMEAQTRLLRVLQQGEYTTVGGRNPIRTDVRIVAATNKDLRQLIRQGLFREDLFFRLNVVPIRLPPLRERAGDIPDLVRHFLTVAEREGLPAKTLEPAAIEAMQRYRWPGNVRELENLLRRLTALYPQERITAAVVENEIGPTADIETADPVDEDIGESMERYLSKYFGGYGESLPPSGLYQRILRDVELPLINAALSATRGNQIKAAELLGLNRNTLRKKVRDLDIRIMRRSV